MKKERATKKYSGGNEMVVMLIPLARFGKTGVWK
jgi:hypothetical protein